MECTILFQVRDEEGLLLISKDAVIPADEALHLLSAITREDKDEEIIIRQDNGKIPIIPSEDTDPELKEVDFFDEDEKNFLSHCTNTEQAVEEFRKAFAGSDKKDESIIQVWVDIKNKGLLNSLKAGHFVKITDSNFPQFNKTGRVIQLKGDEVLVSFAHSTVWVGKSILEVVESPSKK